MFAHSLRSFAPRLLTYFVRSLHFRSLTSFVRSWCSLCSCFCRSLRSLLACSLTSFVRSSLAHSLRSFAALSLIHFVRSLLACSLTSFVRSWRSLRSRFTALQSCISLRSIQSLRRRLSIKKPSCLHYHFLQFARTITFSISPVPSLFPIRLSNRFVPKNFSIKLCWYPHAKKFLQKCAKCAGTPMSYTTYGTFKR